MIASHFRSTKRAAPQSAPAHILDNVGRIGVIVPRGSTNQIFNPDVSEGFFTNPLAGGTVYDPLGAVTLNIDRVVNRRNQVGIRVEGNDASGGVTTDVDIGQGYNSFSVDIIGPKGATYQIGYQRANGTDLVERDFTLTGFWQREAVTLHAGSAIAAARVFARRSAPLSSGDPFWLDGFQHEYSEEPTSFISGSSGLDWCGQDCFRDGTGRVGIYAWDGQQNNSASSRHPLTRAGGTHLSLQDAGFFITGIDGQGASPVQNVTQQFAALDGSHYQTQCYTGSEITVSGFFAPCEKGSTIHKQRLEVIKAIKSESRNVRDPIVLTYREVDCDCGDVVGREMQICATYVAGLEGVLAECNRELNVSLQFTTLGPFWSEDGFQTRGRRIFNADNNAEFCVQVGNRGAASTSPLLQFVGGSYEIESIYNSLNGNRLVFDTPLLMASKDQLLNINTDPLNTFARLVDKAANTVTNVSGRLVAGSSVSTFELLPERANPICVTLTNVAINAVDPADPVQAQIRVLSKVQFDGVDAANCMGPLDRIF